MNEVAKLLSEARNGRSFRSLAGSRISPQSLINYENGTSLPTKKILRTIVKCFGNITLDALVDARQKSILGITRAPLPVKPFLNALRNTGPDDHLVVVTQNSLIEDKNYLAGELLELLDRGLAVTYVAYKPKDHAIGSDSGPWRTNHPATAWIIQREARNAGKADLLFRVQYLQITGANDKDFAFLRAFGALSYLRRGGKRPLNESILWSETQSPGGEAFWSPLPYDVLSELNYWLMNNCGLRLPTTDFDRNAADLTANRRVDLNRLEDFIAIYG